MKELNFSVSVIWKNMRKGEGPLARAILSHNFNFQKVAVPGKGLQSMWYTSYEVLYFPRSDSNQVPWGKGEKYFVKRVKCATNCYRIIILDFTDWGDCFSLHDYTRSVCKVIHLRNKGLVDFDMSRSVVNATMYVTIRFYQVRYFASKDSVFSL